MPFVAVTNSPTDPLAYMTAKAHGLEDECKEILEVCGVTADDVTLPELGKPLARPKATVPTFKNNWPTKVSDSTNFEKILMQQLEGNEEDEDGVEANGDEVDGDGVEEEEENNLIDD